MWNDDYVMWTGDYWN